MSAKYTIRQFQMDFPDDDACLDKMMELRFNYCPCCSGTEFKRLIDRKCYQCLECYNQFYPCAGTPLQKTTTPLTLWFYVMFLFTTSKNGISAYEVQRQIGVTYKTAWRMLKQIRILLSLGITFEKLSGVIEMDESFVGGKNKNRHKEKKVKNSQGRSFKDKTPILGMFERVSKQVKCFVIPDTKRKTIQPIISQFVHKGSTIMTDEWCAYQGLGKHYDHQYVDHSKRIYSVGNVTSNRVENLWSVLKRTFNGSYIHVSRKYLQLYANEVTFRQNYRNSKDSVFSCLLGNLSYLPAS